MSRERSEYLSLVYELSEVFRSRGIRKAFYDLDDTIVDTYPEFASRIKAYSEYISSRSNNRANSSQIFDLMSEMDKGIRAVDDHVLPYVIHVSAGHIANIYGVKKDDVYEQEVEKLMGVYGSRPPQFEGARESVELIKDAGLDSHVVTHGDSAWSIDKVRSLGWGGVFDSVQTVPIHKAKDSQAWFDAIWNTSSVPGESIVVGNSLNSDILPSLKIGVAKAVWVAKGSKVEAPEGVLRIEHIKELPQALISL